MGANMSGLVNAIPAITTAAGVYSDISAASARRDAYDANAAAADIQAEQALKAAGLNAATEEARARDAVARGGVEEEAMRRRFKTLRGKQRAQAAAMGIETDSGSAARAVEVSRGEEERDVAVNALNRAREAWGYRVQAANALAEGESDAAALRYQGTIFRIQGKSALRAAYTGGFADLLSLAPVNVGQAVGGGTIRIPGSNPAPYVPPDSVASDDAAARALRLARRTPSW
jgi:hypothetical protein